MISYLTGTIINYDPPNNINLLTDYGVGYEVTCVGSDLNHKLNLESRLSIHTQHIVREDHQSLYGFEDIALKKIFNLLLKIPQVGPKVAADILNTLSIQQLTNCCIENDIKLLTTVPRIGKSKAERLIIELKQKIDLSNNINISNVNNSAPWQDALLALINLGFDKTVTHNTLKSAPNDIMHDTEKLIRYVLNKHSKTTV